MPAYNAGKTIEESLQSAVNQTYENTEIIVIDDGSTDNTRKIADEFACDRPNIRVISQENSGVGAARNNGIKLAKGEFIAPLDADDLWDKRRIEKHVDALMIAGEDAAVAYSPFLVIDEDSRVALEADCPIMSGDVYWYQLGNNIVGNGSGITVRRSAAIDVGGYETSLPTCEDFLFQMHLAKRYEFVCVPEYLIGYRRGKDGLSSNTQRMAFSKFKCVELLRNADDESNKSRYNRAMSFCLGRLLLRSLPAESGGPLYVADRLGENVEGMEVKGWAILLVFLPWFWLSDKKLAIKRQFLKLRMSRLGQRFDDAVKAL